MVIFAGFRVLSLAAILMACGAASAAEIVATTQQVNPASDPANSIDGAALVPDADGGFSVIWGQARGSDPTADELYSRSFDDALGTSGPGGKIDGRIDGLKPSTIRIAGGMRLKNGDVYFGWEALFESAHNPECVGRIVRDDKPRGPLTPYDNTSGFVAGCRVLQLASGRGLAYWTNGGTYTGRMISRKGEIGPTPVDLTVSGMSLARPGVFALDAGFAGFFVRFPPGGGFEVNLQVYDDDGIKEGPPFVVIPANPSFGVLNGVGLASGKIVVLRFLDDGTGDVTGRVFTRAGRRLGKIKTIVGDATFNNALPAVALPDSGFLLALEDGTFDVKRIVLTRFGDDLRKVGAAASTRRMTGLVRTDLKLLDDGRAAAAYVVDSSRVFVAVVEP